MWIDDSEYWGLFENRPAKERTSSAASDSLDNRDSKADRDGRRRSRDRARDVARC